MRAGPAAAVGIAALGAVAAAIWVLRAPEPIAAIRQRLDAGDLGGAEARARDHLARIESAGGDGSLEQARTLDLLVEARWRLGKASEPETMQDAERALEIKEALLDPQDLELSPTVRNLCILRQRIGPPASARPDCERMLAIRRLHLPPDHASLANGLIDLANLLVALGNFDGARDRYEEALAIHVAHDPRGPDAALAHNNLARCLNRLGAFEDSRREFEEALAIFDERGTPAPYAHHSLAVLLQTLGEHRAARSHYEEALRIWEEDPNTDPTLLASVHNSIAFLLEELRAYDDAREHYQAALEILRARSGGTDGQVATILVNLARTERRDGDLARSRALFEEALAALEGSDEKERIAMALEEYAFLLSESGERAHAPEVFLRADAMRVELGGEDDVHRSRALAGLAALRAASGDLDAARALYEQVRSLEEACFGPDHPDVADTLRDLAIIEARRGEPGEALDLALQAAAILRGHLQLTMPALSEREALRYLPAALESADLAMSLALDEPRFAPRAWDAQIRLRAQVLDEMAERRRRAARDPGPELRSLQEEQERIARDCSHIRLRGPREEDPAAFPREVADCRRRFDEVERRLAEASERHGESRSWSDAGLAEVRAALPQGSALVAFRLHDRPDREAGGRVYSAFVLASREAEPGLVPLGGEGEIDAGIEEWAREAGAEGTGISDREGAYRRAGEKLRLLLWDPVASRVAGATSVFVVPDGATALVSFAALPTGGMEYLLESGPLLHYLSAERDLLRQPAPSGHGLLAVGGAEFGAIAPAVAASQTGGECADFAQQRFPPLPASAAEVEEVARTWPGGDEVTILEGAGAVEARFKREAPGHRVLHLATHGFFLQERCTSMLSGLHRGIGIAMGAPPTAPDGGDPLQLSGLVLAGANLRDQAAAGEEDGILTAAEIAAMDLDGVEWAVLSACDTGRGAAAVGDGVLGLRRAFRVAGAGTVIMSLWKVADEPTREWMVELHRARNSGMETAEAVHEASRRVLVRRRTAGESTHPFFWAGFIASGDWR